MGRIIWMALGIAVIALIGIALFRPATLFGVDADALANSLGAEIHQSQALCQERGAERWRCLLEGSTVRGVEYSLSTDRYGCWEGTKVAQPGSVSLAETSPSGCIGL